MAKRKPTATQRLRKLVQQQVRRMENRGYRIDTELKEKIKTGKYQTLQSIRKNKYAKLYEGSSAEIDTNIVSGRRYRQYERKVSAEKAVQTRRQNRTKKWKQEAQKNPIRESAEERTLREPEYEDVSGYDEEEWTDADEEAYQSWKRRRQEYYNDEDYESDWEEQHREPEQQEWEETRAKQDEADLTLANAIDEGQVMYRNILDLMEKFPREGRNLLYQGLESEIRQYGLDMVMAGMAYAPMDVVQEAQNIIFYTGDKDSTHRALVNFFDNITGTIRTIQDSMGIGAVLDQMTDMSEL